jgi:hypothetical protein
VADITSTLESYEKQILAYAEYVSYSLGFSPDLNLLCWALTLNGYDLDRYDPESMPEQPSWIMQLREA